jgi:hypothetical protein
LAADSSNAFRTRFRSINGQSAALAGTMYQRTLKDVAKRDAVDRSQDADVS